MSSCSSFSNAEASFVLCKCGMEAHLRTSGMDKNLSRRFYGCRLGSLTVVDAISSSG
ncbi:hypothetical protein ACS0TY_023180 [Phlomoides rotata]